MDKVLNYLALARKGGRAELGEEPVGAIARALKAHLIVVAYKCLSGFLATIIPLVILSAAVTTIISAVAF